MITIILGLAPLDVSMNFRDTGFAFLLDIIPGLCISFLLEYTQVSRVFPHVQVRTFSLKMLQRIFSRHDLWERRLVRLQ